ncbi:hypothetical protein GOV04_01600 [Candidatus Woesearchaeota archaeon]|nr:hypothetical protein [Candidatus Woesearchaeota archaeon]
MNVEKLQKLNKLSKELQKHGIALDSQSASEQAQQIIPDANNEAGFIGEAMQSPTSQVDESSITPTGVTVDADETSLQMRKQNVKLEDHTNQINVMQDKINELISYVKNLEEQLTNLKPAQTTIEQAAKKSKPKEEKLKDAKTEGGHVRSGNYKPEDVAMEKVFYFGSK